MTLASLTMLFTDIVDSTPKVNELGDRAWGRLLARHNELLRATIERHGGTLVNTTGDGALATFPVAPQAVRAAAAAIAAMAEIGLPLRTGVHSGPVERKDDDLSGAAIHFAARVSSRAVAGQVLVTGVVREQAANTAMTFESLGDYELKGFPGTHELFVFTGEQADDLASTEPVFVPLPDELDRRWFLPFLGREAELAQMTGVWKHTMADLTGFLVVGGESGIGKTRLCNELAAEVSIAGGVALYGRCDEGAGVTLQPFREALGTLIGTMDQEFMRAVVGLHAAELVKILPEIADRLPLMGELERADPMVERHRLFLAVAGALTALCALAPVMLVLDDLQWADPITLQLIEHLAGRLVRPRLLIVLNYRPEDAASGTDLRATLASLGRQREDVVRLELNGLEPSQTAELVAAACGDLAGDLALVVDAIHAESDGNPRVIGEVLRRMVGPTGRSRRMLSRAERASQAPVDLQSVMATVGEHIAQRIAELPRETRQMLEVAALFGRDFPIDVMRELHVGRDVAHDLEVAEAARLVTEADRPGILHYRFTHPLVRATLLSAQGSARRAISHASIAQAYERVYAGRLDRVNNELAHHWAEAAPAGYSDQALSALSRAADEALRADATEAALRYYDFALELLEEYGGTEQLRTQLLAGQLAAVGEPGAAVGVLL